MELGGELSLQSKHGPTPVVAKNLDSNVKCENNLIPVTHVQYLRLL